MKHLVLILARNLSLCGFPKLCYVDVTAVVEACLSYCTNYIVALTYFNKYNSIVHAHQYNSASHLKTVIRSLYQQRYKW